MSNGDFENYKRIEEKVDSLPESVDSSMEKSIAKYIRKHGAKEVSSTKAGAYILRWKEAEEWKSIFGPDDAGPAFGIFLKRYMTARAAEWHSGELQTTERGTTERVYKRR